MSRLGIRLFGVLSVVCSNVTYGADTFEILNRDGTRIAGAVLQELGQTRVRFQADRKEFNLPRSSMIGFRTGLHAIPRTSGSATLRLVNGDILTGDLAALDDSKLVWVLYPDDQTSAVRVEIPLEYVLGITFGLSLGESLKTLVSRVTQAGADRIRLSNEDELTGNLSELGIEQLALDTETGTTTIPMKSVRSILFNDELTETPVRVPERTLIMLEPGTRITLSDFQITRDSLIRGNLVFGASLELPLKKLRGAVLLDSAVRALSEREPSQVTYQPFLSTISAYRANSGVRGGPLQSDDRPYLTGFGMQSRTELTFTLAPGDDFLVSDIGLDVEAGKQGSIRFRILLDGKQAFESAELTGRDPPQPIRLDLHDKQSLTLITDFGRDGDVLDLAAWGNTLILSQPAAP